MLFSANPECIHIFWNPNQSIMTLTQFLKVTPIECCHSLIYAHIRLVPFYYTCAVTKLLTETPTSRICYILKNHPWLGSGGKHRIEPNHVTILPAQLRPVKWKWLLTPTQLSNKLTSWIPARSQGGSLGNNISVWLCGLERTILKS